MKIEIKSGIHTKRKTKESKLPSGINTDVWIDGKRMEGINELFFSVKAGEIAEWSITATGDLYFRKIQYLFSKGKFIVNQFMRHF